MIKFNFYYVKMMTYKSDKKTSKHTAVIITIIYSLENFSHRR